MCTNPLTITVNGEEVKVKCGKCPTCQRQKSSEWAIKLINEAKYHKKSCFLTLTFDDKILKKGNKYGANCSFLYHITNSRDYVTKFIKRLRKHYKTNLTYYMVGEYGALTKRCHWHILIFGEDFTEKKLPLPSSKTGHEMYMNPIVYKLWGCGRIAIQKTNEHNITYISQYSLKKFKNNELNKRYRPIQSFSNRSKINIKWARRNYKELARGYIEDIEHKKYKIPQSYLKMLKESTEEKYNKIYREIEEKQQDKLLLNNDKERIKKDLKKEYIQELRMKKFNPDREFE